MEYVANYIIDFIINNDKLLMSSFGAMVLYIMSARGEPIPQRILHGGSGFIASLIFAKPMAIWFGLPDSAHIFGAGIALCGQFIPELLQVTIKKIANVNIEDKLNKLLSKGDKNDKSNN